MKKHFNKELLMAKKDEDIENSSKCWNCDNFYVDGDVNVRVIVISMENMEALHIEIVILRLKFNHNIPIIFHNLKSYDSHLVIHELGKTFIITTTKCVNLYVSNFL